VPAGPVRAEPADQSLPTFCRLHKRGQFQKVQMKGKRAVAGSLVLLVLPNDTGVRRLGVTVSSKVGNSVVRSKIKRWFRDIFRKERSRLPPSLDVVMVARASAAQSNLEALRRDFARAAEVFSASQRAPA
jgi:ribonuclease P protein component